MTFGMSKVANLFLTQIHCHFLNHQFLELHHRYRFPICESSSSATIQTRHLANVRYLLRGVCDSYRCHLELMFCCPILSRQPTCTVKSKASYFPTCFQHVRQTWQRPGSNAASNEHNLIVSLKKAKCLKYQHHPPPPILSVWSQNRHQRVPHNPALPQSSSFCSLGMLQFHPPEVVVNGVMAARAVVAIKFKRGVKIEVDLSGVLSDCDT